MTRHWYLIDENGWHRIDVSDHSWDFWSEFRSEGDEEVVWPAFTQAAVRAGLDQTRAAVEKVAGEFELSCRDVTHLPEQWDEGVCLAQSDELTLLAEPRVDLAQRFVSPQMAERLMATLEADGAFFGFDPAAATLMLTVFSEGAPQFVWSDSLSPGPSQALTIHDDGSATDEDPRRFALRRMGQPETSPFLDRYAFVEHELDNLGLNSIQPELSDLVVEAVIHLEPQSSRNLG